MSRGVFSQRVHTWIQIFSFALIAIGMPTTKVLMSFGLTFAIANWILEGNFAKKWEIIRSNKALLFLIGFYVLLLVGLLWSWDIAQGLKDLKSRLPFLFLPLIIATSPKIELKWINFLLYLFLGALFLTSIYNVLYYHFATDAIDDIRGLSRFASHIRYSLLIVLGFGTCIWFQIKQRKLRVFYLVLAGWFVYYTIYSQILSGFLALILAIYIISFYLLFYWKKWMAYTWAVLFFSFVGGTLFQVFNLSHESIDCSKLPPLTDKGIAYNHDCRAFSEINGKAILAYYSEVELYLNWITVSDVEFFGKDKKGGDIRMTLARYLTSLGVTKDEKGFKLLTKQDIQNIEDGYTYPNERNELFMPRLYGIKYQLLNNKAPNGHSLLQRLEHWKTSVYIIKKHWMYGVGTGGNQKVFDKAYDETNSPLNPENRVRSHNMFLTVTISYGIVGLLFFTTLLIVLLSISWKQKNLLGLISLVVIISSFLIEDTIETQLGVTIFGFFVALLFVDWKETETL
ncbi:MAG: O-antigen ligase family protein [Crocinitomicaceae bacterium]|nr:O-antigen ligase family protein [Crocinitomicaceae bacterium]